MPPALYFGCCYCSWGLLATPTPLAPALPRALHLFVLGFASVQADQIKIFVLRLMHFPLPFAGDLDGSHVH
jgi:hypothetical protein